MPTSPPPEQPTWSAWQECRSHWRAYLLTVGLALAAALVVSMAIPRTYSAQVKVANENEETDLLLGLNNVASWAKSMIDEQEGLRQPEVYGQLIPSFAFAEEMGAVEVPGTGSDYYHHLLKQREPWWAGLLHIGQQPMSEREHVNSLIHSNVRSKISSKYGTVIIQVTDQYPVVAAQMADSARVLLQRHLADYARDRAHRDLTAAATRAGQAQRHFEAARSEWIRYTDSHSDLTSPKALSMADHLQKEYAGAFDNYRKSLEQYRRAEALVGKESYSFAVVKNATVPLRASGPATAGYILAYVTLALLFTTWWVLLRRTLQQSRRPWTSH